MGQAHFIIQKLCKSPLHTSNHFKMSPWCPLSNQGQIHRLALMSIFQSLCSKRLLMKNVSKPFSSKWVCGDCLFKYSSLWTKQCKSNKECNKLHSCHKLCCFSTLVHLLLCKKHNFYRSSEIMELVTYLLFLM